MCALTALCSVCCVVSTKHTQRLQAAGLRLRNRNRLGRSGRAPMILIVSKYRSEWERLSCRKLPMDQYANCGTILPKMWNFTKHEKSEKISAPTQCEARFNLNFEKIFFMTL